MREAGAKNEGKEGELGRQQEKYTYHELRLLSITKHQSQVLSQKVEKKEVIWGKERWPREEGGQPRHMGTPFGQAGTAWIWSVSKCRFKPVSELGG